MTRMMTALMLTTVLAAPAWAAPQVAQSRMSGAPEPNATGCKLVYGGGPLLQHVKVFDVFYSPGNLYKDMLTAYYTGITQSAYFDWLSEYNVTNYKIGRGSFAGAYEDTNSATAQVTLDDSQIGPYLDKLITANKIPAPDNDTIYQIYFPASVTITLQGQQSCSVFCAYHNSYMHGSQIARYSVVPDVTKAPCAGGCGTSPTQFNNLTSVSSHELIEAVTDPDNNGAWVDQKSGCGEIGDICNGQEGTIATYTVQKEWSNSLNSCIVTNPAVSVNDFTVAVAPSTVNVAAGGMSTATVTLTKVAGVAENATLTATGLPTGVTASFSPTSVTSAGGTAMVTISAAPTLMAGSMQKFTVKATGMTVAPTADVTVMVIAPPDMAMSPDLAQPSTGGGGSGGGTGGNGGNGGSGGGTGGNGGSGGSGGSGGNGNNGGGGSSGCAIGGGEIAGSWAVAGLLLLALATRRRRTR